MKKTPSVALRTAACAALAIAATAAPALADPVPNLETTSATQLEALLKSGSITSVQLTQAYIDRINALNKQGPGLNAVTQFNADALKDAAASDKQRAAGTDLGPVMGLPVLLKDIVDAKGMYTSAGNFSLRDSFPAEDSGVTKKLRAGGAIILGKLGLSEWANSFGNQPSGFSNLTGQVLNGIDADQNPSGSSSGSGSAAAAALSALTIGTETSGSIISPSATQGVVGLRPTVGLVPGYGIAPISASQDTAGPIVRTVADAAAELQIIAGPDPEADQEYKDVFGDGYTAQRRHPGTARHDAGLLLGAQHRLRARQADRLLRQHHRPVGDRRSARRPGQLPHLQRAGRAGLPGAGRRRRRDGPP